MQEDAATAPYLDDSVEVRASVHVRIKPVEGYKGKRAFDIIVASVLVLATLPVMLITAVLVWLTSSGPILFCQQREGKGGKYFTLYKFRTLQHEAPEIVGTVQDDCPHFTPCGRWLRRTHIDELPQFWNVLRGDMHIVGPRPNSALSATKRRAKKDSRYDRVIRRKPGLTCPVSLAGKWEDLEAADPLFDATKRELEYQQAEESLPFDLKMFFLTALKVLGVRFTCSPAKQ